MLTRGSTAGAAPFHLDPTLIPAAYPRISCLTGHTLWKSSHCPGDLHCLITHVLAASRDIPKRGTGRGHRSCVMKMPISNIEAHACGSFLQNHDYLGQMAYACSSGRHRLTCINLLRSHHARFCIAGIKRRRGLEMYPVNGHRKFPRVPREDGNDTTTVKSTLIVRDHVFFMNDHHVPYRLVRKVLPSTN